MKLHVASRSKRASAEVENDSKAYLMIITELLLGVKTKGNDLSLQIHGVEGVVNPSDAGV